MAVQAVKLFPQLKAGEITLTDLAVKVTGAGGRLAVFETWDAAFFHHKLSAKIIDYQPARRDNRASDWGSFEGHPSTKTALETAPKPFQRSFRS